MQACHAMGKGPDKRGQHKASERGERNARRDMRNRLARRAASLGGVKRKRCRRCIVPFVEDAALAEPEPVQESPPVPKRVKRQARVLTDEEKAGMARARNPSSCSCSSGGED